MRYNDIKHSKYRYESTSYPSVNRTQFLAYINSKLFSDLLENIFDEPKITMIIKEYRYTLSYTIDDIQITWDGYCLVLTIRNQSYTTNRLDKYWLLSTIAYYM